MAINDKLFEVGKKIAEATTKFNIENKEVFDLYKSMVENEAELSDTDLKDTNNALARYEWSLHVAAGVR